MSDPNGPHRFEENPKRPSKCSLCDRQSSDAPHISISSMQCPNRVCMFRDRPFEVPSGSLCVACGTEMVPKGSGDSLGDLLGGLFNRPESRGGLFGDVFGDPH